MTLEKLIIDATKHMSPVEVQVLIYHAKCQDGSAAALAAWNCRGTTLEYIPLEYNGALDLESLTGKNVMLVDVTLPKDQMQQLRQKAAKILVLDHHETAAKENAEHKDCFFTMENSGAVLAWRYFYGFTGIIPRFFQLIEDRDLWRWRDRYLSEPLFYAIQAENPTLDFKAMAIYLFDVDALYKLIQRGQRLVEENKRWCAEQAVKARPMLYKSKQLERVFNVTSIELASNYLISELAEYLYTNNNMDFVLLWYKNPDGKYKLSLRTNKDDVNVATIAEQMAYGGGGHQKAAGALLEYSPYELIYSPGPDTCRVTPPVRNVLM